MKFTLSVVLPLAVSAISLPNTENLKRGLTARQFLPFNIDPYANLAELSVVRTEKLAPKLRKDAKRIRITWGPVTAYSANDERENYVSVFPSGDADNPADTMWQQIIPGIPSDITMLWGKIDMADARGKQITADDGIYLHHIQLFQTNSPKVKKEFCFGPQPFGGLFTPRSQANVVIGAGSSDYEPGFMFTTPDAKFNSGYYVSDDARFMFSGEVVNYKPKATQIYPTFEIEYIDGKPAGLMDVSVMLFSVTGCSTNNPGLEFQPEEGTTKFDVTSEGFPLPEDGYIINALGHIHDGGDRVISKINGKLICDSQAKYGHPKAGGMMSGHEGMEGMALGLNETIVSMGNCAKVIPVKKGDLVTLTAKFDLAKHGGRVAAGQALGEMATTTMYFAPRVGAVATAADADSDVADIIATVPKEESEPAEVEVEAETAAPDAATETAPFEAATEPVEPSEADEAGKKSKTY